MASMLIMRLFLSTRLRFPVTNILQDFNAINAGDGKAEVCSINRVQNVAVS